MTTLPITFVLRPSELGPIFGSGSFLPPSTQIDVSDEVMLHLDNISVRVVVREKFPDGNFSGIIVGFENYADIEFHGLTEGRSVEFAESNVFGCIKKD